MTSKSEKAAATRELSKKVAKYVHTAELSDGRTVFLAAHVGRRGEGWESYDHNQSNGYSVANTLNGLARYGTARTYRTRAAALAAARRVYGEQAEMES